MLNKFGLTGNIAGDPQGERQLESQESEASFAEWLFGEQGRKRGKKQQQRLGDQAHPVRLINF